MSNSAAHDEVVLLSLVEEEHLEVVVHGSHQAVEELVIVATLLDVDLIDHLEQSLPGVRVVKLASIRVMVGKDEMDDAVALEVSGTSERVLDLSWVLKHVHDVSLDGQVYILDRMQVFEVVNQKHLFL